MAKLTGDGASVCWSTYVGGPAYDGVNNQGLAVDASDCVVVTGITASTAFPLLSGQGGGVGDGLVAKITSDGVASCWAWRIGGPGYDWGHAVRVHSSGDIVAIGCAQPGFPFTDGAFDTQAEYLDAYVLRLAPDTGSVIWSTAFGGPNYEEGYDCAIDPEGCIILAGPIEGGGLPLTPDAHDPTPNGDWDGYIARISPTGDSLLYSTYFGGGGTEYPYGLDVSSDGAVFVTGFTQSSNYPVFGSGWSAPFGGSHDLFVVKLDLGLVLNHDPIADAGDDQTVACAEASTSVQLNGSRSYDPDGDDITYAWSRTGAEPATGAFPTVELPVGTHVITLKVTDPYDAWDEDEVVITVRDTAPPTTEIGWKPAPVADGWNAGAVTVTLTATDAGSGVKETKYRIDVEDEQVYTGPFVVSGEGAHELAYWSTDVADNVEQAQTRTIRVDTGAPTTTPIMSPEPNAAGWHKSPVTVTLNATDAGSGVAETLYSLDSGAWQRYAGPVLVEPNGDHTVRFYSKDHAGNAESEKSVTFRIDSVPPVTVLTCIPEPNAAGWNNTAVTLTLTASDDRSGVAGTTFHLDGGSEQPYSAPIVISGEGEFDVAYWSSDVADNVEQAQTRTIRVDTIAPTTTAAVSPGANAAGWHKGPVTVTLNATDTGSGVDKTYIKIGTAEAIEYAGPFVMSAEGDTRITFWSVDVAGNTETEQTLTIRIDLTAPVVTITSPEHKTYIINEAVTAAYSCSDAVSGVASCEATLPNGAVLDTTTPGTRTFQVTATDLAGNVSSAAVDYSVGYRVIALYDQNKTHKSGSTIPIKVQVVDANGVNLSSPDLVVTAVQVFWVDGNASQDPEDSGNANPDLNFRYIDGKYIFNLSTKGYGAGTWEMRLTVAGDSTVHAVRFKIR